jgi:hypothetical protein
VSEPIKVGDLVQVVRDRPCGCRSPSLGTIFGVQQIRITSTRCDQCDAVFTDAPNAVCPAGVFTLTTRLKRIPPLGELEGEKRKEELTA